MERFRKWFQESKDKIKQDYFRFLRFESVSADPAYKKNVLDCAKWLKEYLHSGGFQSELITTPGYPIVYAEDSAGPNAPTILMYGHYDVQPVDPVDLWQSPPFEPTEREGKIFARGAVDNKGQIFYAISALIAWKKHAVLPVNVKFCIEGEEESHSMGLSKSLHSLKEKMKADYLLIVDFDSLDDGTFALTFGARGCVSLEFKVIGSSKDLHSGIHGGIAYNPNRAIAEMLASLWDQDGKVVVPGFYDHIEDPSQEDLDRFTFRMDEKELEKNFGIRCIGGEKNRTMQEKNWFRPTLEINGVFGGYSGAGNKTVIPSEAGAKLSCRLVPGQDPDRVAHKVADFLKQKAPKGMDVKFEFHGGMRAFRSNPENPLSQALLQAAEEVTHKKSVRIMSGASIPIAAEMSAVLNAKAIGMGYGLSTDDIHAPNEHFDMKRFEKGFLTIAKALELFGKQGII